jgi:hypothetical protein
MQRVKSSTEEIKLGEMRRLTLETGNLLEVHPGTVKASPGAVSHKNEHLWERKSVNLSIGESPRSSLSSP